MSVQKQQRPQRFFSSYKPRTSNRSATKKSYTNLIDTQPSSMTITQSETQKGVIILYNFWLGTGNNVELIRKVLLSRGNWNEVQQNDRTHLKWAQTTRGYKYDLLGCSGRKQMYNHFENYSQLNNKALLIRNLNEYCENNRINMFSFTPITFVVNLNDMFCDKIISDFLIFYSKHNPTLIDSKTRMDHLQTFRSFIRSHCNKYKAMTNKFSKYNMVSTFLNQTQNSYLWLLKPTELNRGRGVRVFSDLQTLKQMIKQYTEGFNQKPLETSSNKQPTFIKTQSFVIQKYIQRPMLINKRKFDIRNWALLDHQQNVYFFKQGYARLSSQQYDISKNKIDNPFIHLTNNAIQQQGQNYCKFQKGNQLSFKDIKQYIKINNQQQTIFDNVIYPKMKEIVETVFKSVRGKINKDNTKFCFEVFGLDFFLDQQLNVWIIQVNMNPCLQQSSPLLSQLIPRMINDAFKLTVDVVFPKWIPLKHITKTKIVQHKLPNPIDQKNRLNFRVDGYTDDVNMWDYICNIKNK